MEEGSGGERLLRFPLNDLENDLVVYQERGNRKNIKRRV